MSSNYKILFYFLKSIDSSLKIGLGLRGQSLKTLFRNISLNDCQKNLNNKCKSYVSSGDPNIGLNSKPKSRKVKLKQNFFN